MSMNNFEPLVHRFSFYMKDEPMECAFHVQLPDKNRSMAALFKEARKIFREECPDANGSCAVFYGKMSESYWKDVFYTWIKVKKRWRLSYYDKKSFEYHCSEIDPLVLKTLRHHSTVDRTYVKMDIYEDLQKGDENELDG